MIPYTTAIINMDTIKGRCEVDDDGCWIWQGAKIQGAPYWSTYGEDGKHLRLGVARLVVELDGRSMARGKPIRRFCGNLLCVCPEHLRTPDGFFSQLVKQSEAQWPNRVS